MNKFAKLTGLLILLLMAGDTYFASAAGGGVTEGTFETIADSAALRATGGWYESLLDSDGTLNLSLDQTNVGGNSGKKAKITGTLTGNTTMSQQFTTPMTQVATVQYDIYVDQLLTALPSAYMFIGDTNSTTPKPNYDALHRFVGLAFMMNATGPAGTANFYSLRSSGGVRTRSAS